MDNCIPESNPEAADMEAAESWKTRVLGLSLNESATTHESYFRSHLTQFRQALLDRLVCVAPTAVARIDVVDLEASLYEEYGISAQGLRILVHLAADAGWSQDLRAQNLRGFAGTLHAALLGERVGFDPDILRFLGMQARMGWALALTRDPRARTLAPFDATGWREILQGPCASATIVGERPVSTFRESAPEKFLPTFSQHRAQAALSQFLAIKREQLNILGIDLRPNPLLVGPSGSGKTAIVRRFCREEALPMQDFNCGTWVVTGARTEPTTLELIRQFVHSQPEGVIFIDEIDKIYGDCSWMRSVQQEIYALLDGRAGSFGGWSDLERDRLAQSFLIVGAGTWQDLYASKQRLAGFGADKTTDGWSLDLSKQTAIPDELLFRFNADHLMIAPPTPAEFGLRIEGIHFALRAPVPEGVELSALIHDAVESGHHARWLEMYASRVARKYCASIGG
jgi:hypothetical protein